MLADDAQVLLRNVDVGEERERAAAREEAENAPPDGLDPRVVYDLHYIRAMYKR
jgi:hypothetical protein